MSFIQLRQVQQVGVPYSDQDKQPKDQAMSPAERSTVSCVRLKPRLNLTYMSEQERLQLIRDLMHKVLDRQNQSYVSTVEESRQS